MNDEKTDGGGNTVDILPMPVIGTAQLRQIKIAGDVFGGELKNHIEDLLISPIFREKVIQIVNKTFDIPILGESTEARIFGQAYDWVTLAIVAALGKID